MDPCHVENFNQSLKTAIGWISGDPLEQDVDNKGKWKWGSKPNTIIFPLCDGIHWRNIRVKINGNECNILYDDPLGGGNFPQALQEKLLQGIQSSVTVLLGKGEKEITCSLTIKELKQQANGWDCGPICLSNIRDYVKADNIARPNSEFQQGSNFFTIREHSPDLLQQRADDVALLDKTKNSTVVFKALEGSKNAPSSNANGNDFDSIFRIAQSYKQAFPNQSDEKAINYAKALMFTKKYPTYYQI